MKLTFGIFFFNLKRHFLKKTNNTVRTEKILFFYVRRVCGSFKIRKQRKVFLHLLTVCLKMFGNAVLGQTTAVACVFAIFITVLINISDNYLKKNEKSYPQVHWDLPSSLLIHIFRVLFVVELSKHSSHPHTHTYTDI